MKDQNAIAEVLKGHQQIPVVSFTEADDPIDFMNYLIQNQVYCIEVTLRTNYALDAIDLLLKEKPENFIVGAGTVIKEDQIDRLSELGVDFMVSPAYTLRLLEKMEASKIAYLPGVATPKDIMEAMQVGLARLKFFPASLFGGIDALSVYAQLFPDIQFCPTGGIDKMSSRNYLKLPNVFAVGGSWFQKTYQIIK